MYTEHELLEYMRVPVRIHSIIQLSNCATGILHIAAAKAHEHQQPGMTMG